MTNYAARGRAQRSQARLTVRLAPRMKRWAEHRSRAWGVDHSWTPDHIVRRVSELRSGGRIGLLVNVPADVRAVDRGLLMWFLPRFSTSGAIIPAPNRRVLTIEELWQLMRSHQPGLSRQRLRNLIGAMERSAIIERVGRARYAGRNDDWDDWADSAADSLEDPDEARWLMRFEQRRLDELTILLCHYLLPRWPVHRKALRLGIGERTYYYRLCSALTFLVDDPENP